MLCKTNNFKKHTTDYLKCATEINGQRTTQSPLVYISAVSVMVPNITWFLDTCKQQHIIRKNQSNSSPTHSNNYYFTLLMSSFQDDSGKSIPECQDILDFVAAYIITNSKTNHSTYVKHNLSMLL